MRYEMRIFVASRVFSLSPLFRILDMKNSVEGSLAEIRIRVYQSSLKILYS